ncbi:porphobilinogen deaminase [Ammonifex degensii KC4]|uniref:Porphobilinogen deaminase n=1 Tax=Ammonifex degensii (strain DSM 10501 / KC4) TaxID=429009 RepID=C9R7U0_AMMDK|nr:hydroxymethylbilane synthase [Ammonifex degensii]ACX52369.1 porphobilinogen deaminase [Ammonifex degensii KC4]
MRKSKRCLRIGTRGSDLALAQTEQVLQILRERWPHYTYEIVKIKTTGDKVRNLALPRIGGKGLFTKELEVALLEEKIDLAVHSLKDLPTELPEELCVGAVLPREHPGDVLISLTGAGLEDLPEGARIGTSSLRRQAQLKAARPDLNFVPLRGNVPTRLRKLEKGECEAVVLAWAGLRRLRLDLTGRMTLLPYQVCLPAVAQGAIGVEMRKEDRELRKMVEVLDDPTTRLEVTAERAFLRWLGGGCHVPIAALARVAGAEILLEGLVADPEGKRIVRGQESGSTAYPEEVGIRLAERLLREGAEELLRG